MEKQVWALGLAEHISQEGVDAALLRTDGKTIDASPKSLFLPYPIRLSERLEEARQVREEPPFEFSAKSAEKLSRDFTKWALQCARHLLNKEGLAPQIVGFIGPHILAQQDTLGDIPLVAATFGCPVVSSFAQEDKKAGGNGRALNATYIQSVIQYAVQMGIIPESKIIAALFLGDETDVMIFSMDKAPVAFRVGPGLCLVDEFTQRMFQTTDPTGRLAGRGDLDNMLVKKWTKDLFAIQEFWQNKQTNLVFDKCIQYSIKNLIPLDGIATLNAFIVQIIEQRLKTYRGLLNMVLFDRATQNFFLQSLLNRKFHVFLSQRVRMPTGPLLAEAAAFLAVRRLYNLPIVFASTTGVSAPLSVGTIYSAENVSKGG